MFLRLESNIIPQVAKVLFYMENKNTWDSTTYNAFIHTISFANHPI